MASGPNVNFLAIWLFPLSVEETSPSTPISNESQNDPSSYFFSTSEASFSLSFKAFAFEYFDSFMLSDGLIKASVD
jgi:hypothetical protein